MAHSLLLHHLDASAYDIAPHTLHVRIKYFLFEVIINELHSFKIQMKKEKNFFINSYLKFQMSEKHFDRKSTFFCDSIFIIHRLQIENVEYDLYHQVKDINTIFINII